MSETGQGSVSQCLGPRSGEGPCPAQMVPPTRVAGTCGCARDGAEPLLEIGLDGVGAVALTASSSDAGALVAGETLSGSLDAPMLAPSRSLGASIFVVRSPLGT